MRGPLAALACLVTFGAGWGARSFVDLKTDAAGVTQAPTTPVRDGDWKSHLDRIESLIRNAANQSSGSPAAPAPEATRLPEFDAERADLRTLLTELKDAIHQIRSESMSLGALEGAQPRPNEPALIALHDESEKNHDIIMETLMGMSPHDVIASFGRPTTKRVLATTTSGISTEWTWAMDSSKWCFVVKFDDNVVHTANFMPRAYLDR